MSESGYPPVEDPQSWKRRLFWAALIVGFAGIVAMALGHYDVAGLVMVPSYLLQWPYMNARERAAIGYSEMGGKIATGEVVGDLDFQRQWLKYGEYCFARERVFFLGMGTLFLSGSLVCVLTLCLGAYTTGLKPTPLQLTFSIALSAGFLALGYFLLRSWVRMKPLDWVEKLKLKVAQGKSLDNAFSDGLGL